MQLKEKMIHNKKKEICMYALIVLIALASWYYFLYTPTSTEQLKVTFTFSDGSSGFDITPGVLSFGKITSQTSSSRSITIENDKHYPVFVSVHSSESVIDHLIISENDFILQPEEVKEITFSLHGKNLIEFGDYTGEVTIISTKH